MNSNRLSSRRRNNKVKVQIIITQANGWGSGRISETGEVIIQHNRRNGESLCRTKQRFASARYSQHAGHHCWENDKNDQGNGQDTICNMQDVRN